MDQVYTGQERMIVLLDIGTTQTAAALIHLAPGGVPKVRVVSRWPGDKTSSKIPTLIYYDRHGIAKAFGAAAMDETVQINATSNEWTKCIHFKLRLHTASMEAPPPYSARNPVVPPVTPSRDARNLGGTFELAPLPANVTIEKVYQDWMEYIIQATRTWWTEVSPDGAAIWRKLDSSSIFVLCHPNGWSIQEQAILRGALALAIQQPALGLERVVFVTEGEASVHFGLNYISNNNWLAVGAEFAVVDAGGSTVDTTVYKVDSIHPKLTLCEVKPSGCVQAGGIFPTRDAKLFIQNKLRNSKYATPEIIDDIVAQFDSKTKVAFVSDQDADHLIKFGYDRDTDRSVGVLRGRLTLTGAEVGQIFKPTMDMIVASVQEQLNGTKVQTILLSGGFGESPALQKRLKDRYQPQIQVITTDEPSRKAVAEGAGYYYLRDSIIARAARYTFGVQVQRPVNVWPPHLLNVGGYRVKADLDGFQYQTGAWSTILKRGRVVGSEEVLSQSFFSRTKTSFSTTVGIWICDRGNIIDGETFMIDTNGAIRSEFQHICDVRADLLPLKTNENMRVTAGAYNDYYWMLNYQIDVMFGGTSLKARITWQENGVKRIGAATIIPTAYY